MTIPHVLIVLDGWGCRDPAPDNAISVSDTPTWDQLWNQSPHCLVSASGQDVGLPDGQMGNSEVGHMNLGTGRIVDQDLTRINKSITDGSFYSNPVLTRLMDDIGEAGSSLHILGLVSPGGVHSHEDQIRAAVKMAFDRGVSAVYVHAFLDGRDVPPKSAAASLTRLDRSVREAGSGGIASIIGRYFAMDRDQRWDRVEKAFRLIATGVGEHRAHDVTAAIEAAYSRGETDEFVTATTISHGSGPVAIRDGDAVLFMNFRADRARELTRAFVEPGFDHFDVSSRPDLLDFVTLTQYAEDLNATPAFRPATLENGIGEYLGARGKTQLRIAETEKYAHVTFFFSGGREEPYPGEDRILVPSPKVATYDLAPEMSAGEVTTRLVKAIADQSYDLIVCNYANGDMVGHTGDFAAACQAVEYLDGCLARVVEAVRQAGGHCLITADHGNVEQMHDPQGGQPHTAHTSNLVPLVYVGDRDLTMTDGGTLRDIAPTLLDLMNMPQPAEMTGHSLLEDTLLANTPTDQTRR
ncbi:MAG: 2,3-bisphosphoglycerate-independent phosphoglycerate mutase [Proteobacteria bacterium]|jgi:2,3-bisphosphoglycerate-independent phosphoglycerate mutase|nr:2,3-bisphosphoglycerate-independent phosphoglycerate mutase [Pseudomonadota bacterium]